MHFGLEEYLDLWAEFQLWLFCYCSFETSFSAWLSSLHRSVSFCLPAVTLNFCQILVKVYLFVVDRMFGYDDALIPLPSPTWANTSRQRLAVCSWFCRIGLCVPLPQVLLLRVSLAPVWASSVVVPSFEVCSINHKLEQQQLNLLRYESAILHFQVKWRHARL